MRETHMLNMPEPVMVPHDVRDALADCLDRELSRLPEKYRIPIVLCDLEGSSHKEAASQLGWPVGTVSSRLSRARALLATRLSRRGVSLTAGSLAALLAQESVSASMPTPLIGSTVQAASLFAAAGAVTAGLVSAEVAALIGEVLKAMLLGKLKIATATLLVASVVVGGGTGLTYRARATEPTVQEARPIDATKPEQKPIEPEKPKEAIPAKSEDLRPADSTPATSDAPRSTHVQRSDLPPLAPQEPGPKEPEPAGLPQDPDQDPLAADPLADQIMTGVHTPKQLERAKKLIESMLTLEKEAQSKSPEELTKMIHDRTNELEEARWQIRVMTAELRRLAKIKETAQVATRRREVLELVSAAQSGEPPPEPVGTAAARGSSTRVRRGRTDSIPKR
jgi:hypothetical protein